MRHAAHRNNGRRDDQPDARSDDVDRALDSRRGDRASARGDADEWHALNIRQPGARTNHLEQP